MSSKSDVKRKSLPAGGEAAASGILSGAPMAAGKKLQILHGLLEEVSRLHHALDALTSGLHADDQEGSGAARRSLLRMLVDLGAQTVPDLARQRDVSRQFVQVEVNGLLAEGFVEYLDNPAHKRSKLVRITPKGFALYKTLRHREEPVSQWLADHFTKSEMREASDLLARLRARADDYNPAHSTGSKEKPTT